MKLICRLSIVVLTNYCSLYNCADLIPFELQLSDRKFFDEYLFKIYNGFSIILHIENSTLYRANALITLIHERTFGEIAIINHDLPLISTFVMHRRRSFLNVIFLANVEKYLNFSHISEHLTYIDVAFFLITKRSYMDQLFWHSIKLANSGNVVIYDESNQNGSLYNVCYYCGDMTKKLNSVPNRSELSQLGLKPRNFKNLQGHYFNAGYVTSFPNMLCNNLSEEVVDNVTIGICHDAIGMEFEILKILSRKLNFTYRLKQYDIFDGKLEKHMAAINSKAFDFVIGGISITHGRASQMSFTYPILIEKYTFLYMPRKQRGSEFLDSIKPFNIPTWVAVFLAIASFSLAFYYSTKGFDETPQFSRTAAFLVCFKAVIEQVEKVKIRSHHTRYSSHTIIVIWWFASLIIATAYKSKLWAISIKNYNIEPSNLEQLLQSDYKIVVSVNNMEIKEDILNNGSLLTIAAQKKIVYYNDTCASIKYIMSEKGAILSEYGHLQYHMLFTCESILKPQVYSKLRLTSESIHHTSHAWPLHKGAAFKNTFDVFIARIDSAGLKFKWKSDCLTDLRSKYATIPYSKTTTSYPDYADKYFLKGFRSAFVVYFLGNIIAFICFVLEKRSYESN